MDDNNRPSAAQDAGDAVNIAAAAAAASDNNNNDPDENAEDEESSPPSPSQEQEPAGEDDDDEESSSRPPSPVYHDNGTVEYSVDAIHEQLVCELCQGLYREPYTTVRCRHTFCRSCLGIAVDAGCFSCPKCQTYLGQDISKFALPDRILQDLIDKVLFPAVAAEDTAKEIEFYQKRGIPRKQETVAASENGGDTTRSYGGSGKPAKIARRDSYRDEITYEVLPEATSGENEQVATTMPALEFPLLQTRGSVHVGQLKKYLQLKLQQDNQNNNRDIELLCHGIPLGDELSVAFVSRTVWMEQSEKLKLTYRYAT